MHGSSAGTPVPLSTMGGLVTLASADSLPEGASPRCYDNDYIVGQTKTRDGLTSYYAPLGVEPIGPNPASVATGTFTNPTGILLNDGSFASASAYIGNEKVLDVTGFAFNLSSSDQVDGILVTLKGWTNSAASVVVSLLQNGAPVGIAKTAPLPTANGSFTLGSLSDMWGAAFAYSDVNSAQFGLQITVTSAFKLAIAYLDYVQVTIGVTTGNSNFDYIGTFTAQNGAVKNLSLDAKGNFFVEDVTNNPGVLTLVFGGVTPNSFAVGTNGPDVEFLAFNDLTAGSDMPRQYTPNWVDRISQVGPGASPVFTAVVAGDDTFGILTITQPPQQSDPDDPGHSQDLLWSAGPGSTSPGNVVTVYYKRANSSSTPTDPDATLNTAFNSGQSVYVYISNAPFQNGTFLVTSVGFGVPPGGEFTRWYFTYQVPTSNYQNIGGPDTATGYYQQTLATMTTVVAVPGLGVGDQVTISGTSQPGYNNVWPISQTLNSGEMAITETSVTASVATYTYSLATGVAPVAGQLVTITGTTNADGALNLVNATIATATGGSSGSFTIPVSVVTAAPAAEQGQATTAGTIFAFDPGVTTLGTLTSPIYGNATGGSLTFAGSGQFIGVGTRQGTVFFITRNGYWTAPGPPVVFTCPANTTGINASLIPIGPPNVIARGISFTEPGQLGTPGGSFYTVPAPVKYIVENVTYVATSLFINDNTTTSATFSFPDRVLLESLEIDVQGQNLFNLIEIGDPGWVVQYDSRNFYGLCRNKIQNFNNLSFDGGYLPSGRLVPLGWTQPDPYGSLLDSPLFGNSYYINNTSGGILPVAGLISQSAYEDAYLQPILNAETQYSVRVTARIPSGNQFGNLTVALVAGSAVYGTFTLPFASMTTTMAIYTGTLLVNEFQTVPSTLMLSVAATEMAIGADLEIDRIEIFPTAIPVLTTTVFGSYANDPESVDAITGVGNFISENQQPVNGAVVMYDTFYALKDSSTYSWRSSPNLEPAQWDEPEVAQRAGACGINAYDFGEQWIVEACRNGVYLYEGGQPGKISQEIYQVWDALNWSAKKCIWVRNDVTGRRLFIGVPMPTPNFWLPNAPVNANPTTPNVILMCNYQGLDDGAEIQKAPQMHTTMFGTLTAIDMRRKWSIWQIPSPYAAFCATQSDQAFFICNGRGNSRIYTLDPAATTDDGLAIDSLYTSFGFVNAAKIAEMPMLGAFNKRTGYMSLTAAGTGNLGVRFLANQLLGPADATVGYNPWTVPGGFNLAPVCLWDLKSSVNFFATRTFVEWRGADWSVSALTLYMRKDVWSSPWGPK